MAEQNIFDKWNKAVDLEGLKKDIANASQNDTEYVDVPVGTYEVKLAKAELKASKQSQNPMVSMWFKVIAGDYKGQTIFMNQIVTQGFQLNIVNNFLRSMDTGINIEFVDYKQYADMLLDVAEACEGLEFALKYDENAKGFKTFEIVEVFDVE